MPVYQLGNGNDDFNSRNQPDWTDDSSSVFGGNGDDTIITAPLTFFRPSTNILVDGGNGNDFVRISYANNSTALGGNGDDTIQLYGGSNSTASGDNGNDTLVSSGGLGNALIGGNGDDTLISSAGGSGMQPGNTLTGGSGRDTFQFANDGNLVVTNDAAGDGIVSDGDTFKGPMDAITDYQRGEHIGLRSYGATADTPLARVDSVALVPELYTSNYNVPPVLVFRPAVGSAEYAVFHGTFAGGNTFTVGADGPDLLAVYDTRTGPFELVGKGSLVLQGVTDERLLAEALSPKTAQGSGGWDYSSFDQTGGGQATLSAALDQPASGLPALGVTPA